MWFAFVLFRKNIIAVVERIWFIYVPCRMNFDQDKFKILHPKRQNFCIVMATNLLGVLTKPPGWSQPHYLTLCRFYLKPFLQELIMLLSGKNMINPLRLTSQSTIFWVVDVC